MSGFVAKLVAAGQDEAPDVEVEVLAECIAGNLFLPVPPPERHFVGDGDFRAIGAEFLRHFVTLGGLKPQHRVLEIGCGIGRMALPLTQYLKPGVGRYDGIDVVADGIAWCREAISTVYGNFRFHHLDVRNELYNPEGALDGVEVELPFGDDSFDFVFMTSVLTHLRQPEVEHYAGEVARLLAPGGRCFVSLFLMDEVARAGLRADRRRLPFDPDAAGPEYLADPGNPAAAVAFERTFILQAFAAAGLRLARPIAAGHWSGRPSRNYQDLAVFERTA